MLSENKNNRDILFETFRRKGLIRYAPITVLLMLLILTLTVWQQSEHAKAKLYQDYFDFRTREAVIRIQQRMGTYVQVLYGVRALYDSSYVVERGEFRSYVSALDLAENYPGIQGLGFSLIIPSDQKTSHLASIRQEGLPEYRITPEGNRNLYTSIVYLEPLVGRNLRAFGYDMYSEPVRHEAMARARDTDKAAMSGKVRLVQETGKKDQAGFLIYLPVYKNNSPHNTLNARQTNIIGWVYSPFRMDDLMAGIQGELADDLDVEIFDGNEINSSTLMYDSDDCGEVQVLQQGSVRESALFANQSIQIAGHNWTVHIRALPGLYGRLSAGNSWPILVFGFMFSALSGWLAWLLIRGRDRAQQAARKLYAQFVESETKLLAILDSSAVAVAWADEHGVIEYANAEFTALFGYTIEDISTIEEWSLCAYPNPAYREKVVVKWETEIARAMQDDSPIAPMEVKITCKNGSVKDVVLMGSRAGRRLLINFNDITARKQAEEMLHAPT